MWALGAEQVVQSYSLCHDTVFGLDIVTVKVNVVVTDAAKTTVGCLARGGFGSWRMNILLPSMLLDREKGRRAEGRHLAISEAKIVSVAVRNGSASAVVDDVPVIEVLARYRGTKQSTQESR
jgi:hypothetical protein